MKDTYVSDFLPHLARVPGHVACLREPLDRTTPPEHSSPAPVRSEAWMLHLAWVSGATHAARQHGALR